MGDIEHTDGQGHRVVWYEGRLSVYGKPSMTADDGTVAVGVDWPDPPFARGAVAALKVIRTTLDNPDYSSDTVRVHVVREVLAVAFPRLGGQSE